MSKEPELIWTDEDGIVHIRNSERGTLGKCPQRWWWGWREGLTPKETAKALWFGTGIHLALAHYYQPGKKRNKDFIDVWDKYADEEAMYMRVSSSKGIDEDEWQEARELGRSMLVHYHKHYGGDKHWNVVGTEQTFSVRIPFNKPHPVYGEFFILDGTLDGVYFDEEDRKFKLMEHKTAASISVRHLPMDNQAGTYWAVAHTVGRNAGWLGSKDNIKEITYNFLRKAMPDTRPVNERGFRTNKPTKEHYLAVLPGPLLPTLKKDRTLANLAAIAEANDILVLGDVSKNQPPPLYERKPVKRTAAQRRTQIQRIKDEVDRMVMYVDGDLNITKTPSRDTCPMCPFSEMCELHEAGSNWIDFRDVVFTTRDPYADHRKDAGAA